MALAEETPNLAALTDASGTINWVNKSFCHTTGYTAEECAGKNLLNLLHGHETDKRKTANLLKHLQQHAKFETTLLHYKKNGYAFWNELRMVPVNDGSGEGGFLFISTDISERVRKNEELLYNELRWKFALEESGDGYFEYDITNEKFYGSENLLSILGLGEGETELDYRKLIGIIHPEDSEAGVNALFDLLEGRESLLRRELRVKIEGDTYTWLAVRATVTNRGENGKPLWLLGTTTDVSYIKETEQALIKAKQEAEAALAYKDSFLATMSHEIRTPLNAVVGLTDLMLKQHFKGEARENLRALSFSANHLLSLINDILDLSKIESGKIEFENSPFELEEIMSGVYNTFLPQCRETGIKLSYQVDKHTPKTITGDAMRLVQVLNNLAGNAVKFTPKGSVKLEVKPTKKTDGGVWLRFEITDTGIGINKKYQERIFDDFVQADSSITKKFGGTGLGLAITKKLVALQGGAIGVKSTKGKGSLFYFEMPFGTVALSKKKERTAKTGNENLGGLKVLLVEDIAINQKVANSYLSHWQAKTAIAANGADALKLFKKQAFDLLLVDLFMPVMDGFETIKRIRETRAGKNIPVIALTASADTDIVKRALAAGADACLGKPINAQQLLANIKKLTGTNTVAVIETGQPIIEGKKFRYINLSRLVEASLGNKKFFREMVGMLQKEIPAYLKEADELLQRKSYAEFAAAIHKLKNSLLMLGMEHLKDNLVLLEESAKKKPVYQKLKISFEDITAGWEKAARELQHL
ncbi:MAG TPA: ATP-binding protein [Chitinophagales bacterium]|nr:ATP-binding protein [Chitinophagales bacterium]